MRHDLIDEYRFLQAGLVDQIRIGIVPLLLSEGLRFFGHIGREPIELERMRILNSPKVIASTGEVTKTSWTHARSIFV